MHSCVQVRHHTHLQPGAMSHIYSFFVHSDTLRLVEIEPANGWDVYAVLAQVRRTFSTQIRFSNEQPASANVDLVSTRSTESNADLDTPRGSMECYRNRPVLSELFRKSLDGVQELDKLRFASVVEDGHRMRHPLAICSRFGTSTVDSVHYQTRLTMPSLFNFFNYCPPWTCGLPCHRDGCISQLS